MAEKKKRAKVPVKISGKGLLRNVLKRNQRLKEAAGLSDPEKKKK